MTYSSWDCIDHHYCGLGANLAVEAGKYGCIGDIVLCLCWVSNLGHMRYHVYYTLKTSLEIYNLIYISCNANIVCWVGYLRFDGVGLGAV